VTVQVGDTDGDTASVSTTNIVADASISATGQKVSLRHGRSVNDAIVATFSSADASLKARDFSATVNWGDGRSSAGIIHKVGSTGNFEVLASHTFRSAGTFSIETSIHQGGAGTALNFFTESDLISDGAVAADHVNPNLVNPWGLVAPNPGDFWDSNNGTGTSSLFDSFGNINTKLPFVTIPAPAGDPNPAAPSGVVFSGSSAFTVTNGTQSGPAAFIFATEDGTIAGWNPKVSTNATAPSTTAVLAVDNSATGAVYKGLTIFNIPTGNPLAAGQYLFVTNFHAGTIEVYNQNFQAVTLPAGEFQDPSIPAGFAPFGIQTLNGDLYVTYAKQDAEKHDDVAGPGNGYVDVYSPSGALLRRLGGPGVQTELNSPWGLTIAPSNFGQFSNDILVGNFGNSHINAFDPSTGAFLGQLTGANGKPLILDGGVKGSDEKGLWGLFAFGASAAAGSTNTVYFSSGFNDESDGLFGSLTATSVAMATAPGVVVVAK
jgi:uncharacterized protein (TIGR03118 family)